MTPIRMTKDICCSRAVCDFDMLSGKQLRRRHDDDIFLLAIAKKPAIQKDTRYHIHRITTIQRHDSVAFCYIGATLSNNRFANTRLDKSVQLLFFQEEAVTKRRLGIALSLLLSI